MLQKRLTITVPDRSRFVAPARHLHVIAAFDIASRSNRCAILPESGTKRQPDRRYATAQ